jgi:hypothetical protein
VRQHLLGKDIGLRRFNPVCGDNERRGRRKREGVGGRKRKDDY